VRSAERPLGVEVPLTPAPPISGELVRTATNTPDDPTSWQNEPGPGMGERPADEVVHRSLQSMEPVARVKIVSDEPELPRPERDPEQEADEG